MTPRVATYRLQLREGMTFERACEVVVPHACALGASHLYLSPPFAAAPGSTHGYDVTDHGVIDPGLGGREGLDRLSAALRERGMGLVIDIVPNHMAADPANPWWRDVCEWGVHARHAGHFDIDWSRRLTLPVLGAPFEEVLGTGEIALRADPEGRGLEIAYHDQAYPLTPPSYRIAAEALPELSGLADIAEIAEPGRADAFHWAMRNALDGLDGRAVEGAERALLARLHDAQPWRLTHWVEARRDLSYRRFFEVTGLVGVRVEDEAVFDDVHRLILELVRDGTVEGLRVDHVDGLRDPASYLRRLREAAPDAWLLVEKITEGHERLPEEWPVEGTTGYEFIATLGDLMVPRRGVEVLEEAFERLAEGSPPEEERDAIKRRTVSVSFEGELAAVVRALRPRMAPEPDAMELTRALAEIVVALPVYRTYGDAEGFRPDDLTLLDGAVSRASQRGDGPLMRRAVEALGRPCAWEARARFQQLTGPAMAKAVEDTLFYRHNALVARNEVGCDPLEPPAGSAAVHRALAGRVRSPHALSATATHDTKRGEGARARLHALAEAPQTWVRLFEGLRTDEGPDPEIQWLLLQAMAGAWGSDDLAVRFEDYVAKALREAKRGTSWTDPDEAYEAAAVDWAVARIRDAAFSDGFGAALDPFVEAGQIGALAQTVLKVAAPGVPDIYQGTEAEDLSLVDPDNRRPPDWARLARLIDGPSDSPAGRHAVTMRRALAVRGERPALFAEGAYRPLPAPPTAFAFERSLGGDRAVAIVPTRPLALVADGAGLWGDAGLDEVRGLHPRLADRPDTTRLGELLWPLPVALLTSWR